jgi:hypothetical protein
MPSLKIIAFYCLQILLKYWVGSFNTIFKTFTDIHINENFSQTESQILQLQKCENTCASVFSLRLLKLVHQKNKEKNRSDSPADRPESEEEGVST